MPLARNGLKGDLTARIERHEGTRQRSRPNTGLVGVRPRPLLLTPTWVLADLCRLLHVSIRMSLPKVKILGSLLETPTDPHYGYELMRATRVKSGSLYPILGQLEQAGWVEAFWEDANREREGRPPRRWYRLTGLGRVSAPTAISGYLAGVRLPDVADATSGLLA